MKIVDIQNNSNKDIELRHKNGAKTTLPPDIKLKNIDITNLGEIKGQVKTTIDLTEVTENSKKTLLYD